MSDAFADLIVAATTPNLVDQGYLDGIAARATTKALRPASWAVVRELLEDHVEFLQDALRQDQDDETRASMLDELALAAETLGALNRQ